MGCSGGPKHEMLSSSPSRQSASFGTSFQRVVQGGGSPFWLYAGIAVAVLLIFVCICWRCRKKKPPAPPAAFDIEDPPARPRKRRDPSQLNFPGKLMKNVRERSRDGYSRSGVSADESVF